MVAFISHPSTDDIVLEFEVVEVRRQPEVDELHVDALLGLVGQDIVQLQVAVLCKQNKRELPLSSELL